MINEIACTVTALRYDADRGTLTEIETVSSLPEGQAVRPGFSTAEIEVHPSGQFLYGSNRGHESIVVFAIHPESGKLKLLQHESTQGKTPRHFGIDPSGNYLLAANQSTDNIIVFKIDPSSGRLTPTGKKVEGVGAPVCVKFVPLD